MREHLRRAAWGIAYLLCLLLRSTASRRATSRCLSAGSSGCAPPAPRGEDHRLNLAVLQEAGEEGGPVGLHGVVGGREDGLDVVGRDLRLAVVQRESGKARDELVLGVGNGCERERVFEAQEKRELTLEAPYMASIFGEVATI